MLAAARRAFTEKGYDAASLRQIAKDAGVDQGMVRHYFSDKAGLFRAAMAVPIDPQALLAGLLAGDRETLGERLLRWFLAQWDEAGEHSPMLILVRSAVTHEESTRMLREFVTEQVLGRLADGDGHPGPGAAGQPGRQPDDRPGDGPVHRPGRTARVGADPDDVVAAVAPTIQRYLTGDHDGQVIGASGDAMVMAGRVVTVHDVLDDVPELAVWCGR